MKTKMTNLREKVYRSKQRAVLVHEAQVFEDLSSLMEEKDRQITICH